MPHRISHVFIRTLSFFSFRVLTAGLLLGWFGVISAQAEEWAATGVLGHSSFSAVGWNAIDASDLQSPRAVLAVGGRLIVADALNHRILIWNASPTASNAPADVVLGQTGFNSLLGGISATKLNTPSSLATDGTRLIVADTGNHRVLIWNTIPTVSGAAADIVVGQTSLTSAVAAAGQQGLRSPQAVWVSGTRLIVADTGNHRVLIWNTIPTTSGAAASVVVGQSDFTSTTSGLSASKLNGPSGVWAGTQLVVADTNNHRVLIWNTIPGSNGASANIVVGQTSLTTNVAGTTQTTLRFPRRVYSDGIKLYVSDSGNSRLLIYNAIPATSGAAASVVVGQGNFTSGKLSVSRTGLNNPHGSVADSSLYVADANNHRVLKWNAVPTINGAQADVVLGHASFTAGSSNDADADGLQNPQGVISVQGKLIGVDTKNHRVLVWNDLLLTAGRPADVVIGQPNFDSTAAAVSASRLNTPVAVATDGVKLFIADQGNHRVLVYNSVPTANGAPADVVVGQATMTARAAAAGAGGLTSPSSVDVFGEKLIITDRGNHRVLIWNTIPTTSGAAASVVVGQPDFISTTSGTAQGKLLNPASAVAWGRLFVADEGNHRVLIWAEIPESNGVPASAVLGQLNFTTHVAAAGATGMSSPSGLYVDRHYVFSRGSSIAVIGRLYVADRGNNRILVFNPVPTISGAAAKWVVGQPDFTTTTSGTTDRKLNTPYGVATVPGSIGAPSGVMSLFVADSGNHRILRGPVPNTLPLKAATPGGPVLIGAGQSGNYFTSAVDPDDDGLQYEWYWGDGLVTFCSYPFSSGVSANCSHAWSTPGTYQVRVRAFDAFSSFPVQVSQESDPLTVTVAAALPTPAIPSMQSLSNPDPDGSYAVQWTVSANATAYELMEATNASFTTGVTTVVNATNAYSFRKPANGTWYYRVRAWINGPGGQGASSGWSGTLIQQVQLAPAVKYTLGTKNNSDAEFKQSAFSADFYPDTQTVAQFPKELNTSWYPAQYLHFSLSQAEADQGLTFHLDPAWNSGTGTLRVIAEAWTGSQWVGPEGTLLNMTEAGYIDLPPNYLKSGVNDLRLRAEAGIGTATALTWDQIVIGRRPFSTVWRLGTNDNSDLEFDQSGFSSSYTVGSAVSAFPQELNLSTFPSVEILQTLSAEQAQHAAVLSLDAWWNDGSGGLTVALERWTGSAWTQIGTAYINRFTPGTIIIPAYYLQEGQNRWRLRALNGTGATTVVMWDSLVLAQRITPPEAVTALLGEILDTTLNYFLSPRAVTQSGLPLTALKVTDRARFGWSNPTEWGYALEAWLIAAERGLITAEQARSKMQTALTTLKSLQADPGQFKLGLFYPFYTVTDASGNDVAPYHAPFAELPCGDNALLWASLNVAEGWLLERGFAATASDASLVRRALNFRRCYAVQGNEHRISLVINADTQELSPYSWLYWADEGGVVNMVSKLSDSTSLGEFVAILNDQQRGTVSWNGHTVREGAFFNAMFTWSQRSILGFPMFGSRKERAYGIGSFLPNLAAHLDYAQVLPTDYAASSDIMTQVYQGQALVGRFTPPNLYGVVFNDEPIVSKPRLPSHIAPHALAVPFCAFDALDEVVLRRLFEQWVLLKGDTSLVWHPAFSQDPFGFEVAASPYFNQSSYAGPDDGRYIFEALGQSYIALSLYEGLQRYGNQRTLNYFARQTPSFAIDVQSLLTYAYPDD